MSGEYLLCLLWPLVALVALLLTGWLASWLRKRGHRAAWVWISLAAALALVATPVPAPLTCPVPTSFLLVLSALQGFDPDSVSLLLEWLGVPVLITFVLAALALYFYFRRRD